MHTAQSAFASLVRDSIAPRLRELGFKGSGSSYTLPDESAWVLIGLQRSQFGDRHASKLTVNVTVVAKDAWQKHRLARHFPVRPLPNRGYGPPAWVRRIGALMPDREDRWWEVRPDSDLPAVCIDILGAIERYALPAIREQMRTIEVQSPSAPHS